MSAAHFPYQVPASEHFAVSASPTAPDDSVPGKKSLEKELAECVEQISELQRKLYADDRYAVLLVFQAMDAAGKDGTIRAVMMRIHAYCNIWCEAKAGWQTFIKRRTAVTKINSLPDASR